ncbi:MAG: lysozyme inhibitor LprI family protein [Pseudomonadota bacterium]
MLLAAYAQLSCAASFDCAKAGTATEKLICSDAKVSTLDEQLNAVYKAANETATDKNAFKAQQRDWLKQKRNVCEDADCLALVYQARISELAKSTSNSALASSVNTIEPQKKMIITTGHEKSLCNDYLALMNRVPRNPQNTCNLEYSFDEKAKTQGFNDIPWKEVDPKQYEDMLLKYWMYINRDWTSDEGKKKVREEFYTKFLPVKHWLWHATFDISNDGKLDEVYKLISRDCTINNADFFIPSEEGFASKGAARIHVNNNLFLYKGKSYTGTIWDIQEPDGDDKYINAGLVVCEFKTVATFK